MWYNDTDLKWQFDFVGPRLMNLRIRVCSRCLDKPFEHWRPIIVPPDPVPIPNPRPDLYAPLMPLLMTDTNGREVDDTSNVFVTASSQTFPPVLSNAGLKPTGLTSAPAIDQYYTTAPDGGPVILVPD